MVFACLLLALAPQLFPYPYDWEAHLIARNITIALLSFVASSFLDFSQLRLKSLLLAFSFFSAIDVAFYPFRYAVAPYIVYALEVAYAFLFMLYIQNKWYDQPSDELDMDHVFLVLNKPTSFLQHLLSLVMPQPTAGVGIYARNEWFHYRKKTRLVEMTSGDTLRHRKDNYLIIQCQPVDAFTFHHLTSLVGSRWSLMRNCLTQLRPIAGKRGEPLFTRGK
jgi:hypothetical protein